LEAEHKREINVLDEKLKSREAFYRGEISALKNSHREEKTRIAEELDRETSKLIEERKIHLESEVSKVKA
jgi:chromosome segregation ATPase